MAGIGMFIRNKKIPARASADGDPIFTSTLRGGCHGVNPKDANLLDFQAAMEPKVIHRFRQQSL